MSNAPIDFNQIQFAPSHTGNAIVVAGGVATGSVPGPGGIMQPAVMVSFRAQRMGDGFLAEHGPFIMNFEQAQEFARSILASAIVSPLIKG